MTVTVIIVTIDRPDCMRRCLDSLYLQEKRPDQIIVVDASSDDITKNVVSDFTDVLYVRTDVGYGHMTASRNLGIRHSTGEIIAFIDDDAFPHPDWLVHLVSPYEDASVGAVGGRALNNNPGEADSGVHEIGRLKPNGVVTGNFAANPNQILEVDHIIGCNMSYRRSILETLGGLREDYPGTEVCEETDICLRVKRLGHRILFNPKACVDHIGAPQAKGKRFDARYIYYATHNCQVLLVRNFGLFSLIVWRYFFYSGYNFAVLPFVRQIAGAALKLFMFFVGSWVGMISGITLLLKTGRDPIRKGDDADQLRSALQKLSAKDGRINQ